jgi:hypothetical protein
MGKTGAEGIATFQAVHNFQFVHHIIVECAASISNSGEVSAPAWRARFSAR